MTRTLRLLAAIGLVATPVAAQAPPVTWDTTHAEWDRAEVASIPVDGGTLEVAALRNKKIPDTFGLRSSFVQIRLQRGVATANVVAPAQQATDMLRRLQAGSVAPATLVSTADGPTLIGRPVGDGLQLEFACAASGCLPAGPANHVVVLTSAAAGTFHESIRGAYRAFGENALLPRVGEQYFPTARNLRDMSSMNVFGAVYSKTVGAPELSDEIIAMMVDTLAALGVVIEGRNQGHGDVPSLVFEAKCLDHEGLMACALDLHVTDQIVVRRTGDAGAATIWGGSDTVLLIPSENAAWSVRNVAMGMVGAFAREYRLVTPGH